MDAEDIGRGFRVGPVKIRCGGARFGFLDAKGKPIDIFAEGPVTIKLPGRELATYWGRPEADGWLKLLPMDHG